MPTKSEEALMAIWLKEMRIAFEVTRTEIDKSIELKLIDYKHNCLLVSKKYFGLNLTMGYNELEKLVKKFEREDVYGILFEGAELRVDEIRKPTFRLIREN